MIIIFLKANDKPSAFSNGSMSVTPGIRAYPGVVKTGKEGKHFASPNALRRVDPELNMAAMRLVI